jgi:hypothetical protein
VIGAISNKIFAMEARLEMIRAIAGTQIADRKRGRPQMFSHSMNIGAIGRARCNSKTSQLVAETWKIAGVRN